MNQSHSFSRPTVQTISQALPPGKICCHGGPASTLGGAYGAWGKGGYLRQMRWCLAPDQLSADHPNSPGIYRSPTGRYNLTHPLRRIVRPRILLHPPGSAEADDEFVTPVKALQGAPGPWPARLESGVWAYGDIPSNRNPNATV